MYVCLFQVIPTGGFYALGQEQDEVAANFSANEAFIGSMSQMNVWSYELPASDIADMAKHTENIIGNVVAWSDFYDPADSGIKKTKPSSARSGMNENTLINFQKMLPWLSLPQNNV